MWDHSNITKSCFSQLQVSVKDNHLSENTTYSVFPNPTKGHINLNINNLNGFCSINIYNNIGQLVDKKEVKSLFDIENVSRGIYYIELLGKNKRKVFKLKKNKHLTMWGLQNNKCHKQLILWHLIFII